MSRTLNIAIAGAGIGGLAAGALLARDGHRVTIFDQFKAPLPVGSGLVIQPVGQAVLAEMDALEPALKAGRLLKRMLGIEAESERRVLDVWYDKGDAPEKRGLAIHRASLFDAVYDAAIHAGAQLVSDHEVAAMSDGTVDFKNQPRRSGFDLLIDASGAGSEISPLKSKPLAFGAIWSTVPWADGSGLPRDYLSQRYRRADKMIGAMPCGTLKGDDTELATIFWSLPVDGYEAWKAEPLDAWKAEAHALWPAFSPFLDTITSHDQMIWADYSHGTMMHPARKGMAFIGDSAHRASPQLGQGANMALLDALALTRALRAADIADALDLYVSARRWHVRLYQWMSWAFTPQYQSTSRLLPLLRDNLFFPVSLIPPMPYILGHLVRGTLIPAIGHMYLE